MKKILPGNQMNNPTNISLIPYSPIIKCMNCDQLFNNTEFVQHICDYDSMKEFIILHKNNQYIESNSTQLVREPFNNNQKNRDIKNNKISKKPIRHLYLCEICGKTFIKLYSLKLHLTFHRNEKLFHYKEQDCNKKISIGLDLNDHEMKKKESTSATTKTTPSAIKYRQYLCDVCGKSYTQSSHLWQHLRFHRGVKPFVCKEPGCNRRFTIRPDLNDHIRKCHTGERPYHCLVCGKRFLTGSVFYQHRLIHRGERRYGCGKCGKRYYRNNALKYHLKVHSVS